MRKILVIFWVISIFMVFATLESPNPLIKYPPLVLLSLVFTITVLLIGVDTYNSRYNENADLNEVSVDTGAGLTLKDAPEELTHQGMLRFGDRFVNKDSGRVSISDISGELLFDGFVYKLFVKRIDGKDPTLEVTLTPFTLAGGAAEIHLQKARKVLYQRVADWEVIKAELRKGER